MRILNFGSLNIDYVYGVTHFVRPGETISSTSFETFCGGKGLNQSIALARCGAETYHAGAVGAEDGAALLELLRSCDVHTQFIKQVASPSGHAIIQVDEAGQNCILLFSGANQSINPAFVDEVLEQFGKGDFLLLQNEISNTGYIITQAHHRGLKIVLNPSPMNEKIIQLPLEYVDYFVLNELEAADLCRQAVADGLADALAEKYPHAHIVLTLGKQGVEYRYQGLRLCHGVYTVPVVDTTAAGDTFTGYFIGALSMGRCVAEALRLASIASSLSVSRQGAGQSIPWMEDVEQSRLQPELIF